MRYSVLYFAWDNIQSVTQEQGYYKSNSGRQLKLTQNIKFIEFEKKKSPKKCDHTIQTGGGQPYWIWWQSLEFVVCTNSYHTKQCHRNQRDLQFKNSNMFLFR